MLPVGGIKEKFLAAYREGVKTILFPHTNAKDVAELPEQVKKEIKLIPVKHMDEVLPLALEGWKDYADKHAKDFTKALAAVGKLVKKESIKAAHAKPSVKKAPAKPVKSRVSKKVKKAINPKVKPIAKKIKKRK